MSTLLLLACGADAGSSPVRVDELAYLRQLQERRPGLMAQHDGGVDDPAWEALVIVPEYRAAFVGQSYAGIGRMKTGDGRRVAVSSIAE